MRDNRGFCNHTLLLTASCTHFHTPSLSFSLCLFLSSLLSDAAAREARERFERAERERDKAARAVAEQKRAKEAREQRAKEALAAVAAAGREKAAASEARGKQLAAELAKQNQHAVPQNQQNQQQQQPQAAYHAQPPPNAQRPSTPVLEVEQTRRVPSAALAQGQPQYQPPSQAAMAHQQAQAQAPAPARFSRQAVADARAQELIEHQRRQQQQQQQYIQQQQQQQQQPVRSAPSSGDGRRTPQSTPSAVAPSAIVDSHNRPSSRGGRNAEEDEYLRRLEEARKQAYADRVAIAAKVKADQQVAYVLCLHAVFDSTHSNPQIRETMFFYIQCELRHSACNYISPGSFVSLIFTPIAVRPVQWQRAGRRRRLHSARRLWRRLASLGRGRLQSKCQRQCRRRLPAAAASDARRTQARRTAAARL